MRDTLYRLTSPFLDQIPDISHQPKGRQISIGLAASIVFHVLLLLAALLYDQVQRLLALLLALILSLLHLTPLETPKPTPKPKLEQIEITVEPPEPEELTPLAVPLKPVLASAGLAESEKPPETAVFQSGVNMKAASELPAAGALPLPSQKGRKEPDAAAFANPPDAPAAAMAPPVAPVSAPEPAEAQTPKPPTDLREVPKPSENEIALAMKSATPAPIANPPQPKPLFRNTRPATPDLAMQTRGVPRERPSPEQLPTEVDGDISNLGKAAASSVATPLGKYLDDMTARVDSRWKHYVRNPAGGVGFPTGSVRVTFSIDRRGKVSVVRSSDNTSNSAFALVSERALLDTELPAPAPGLFDDLPGRKFTHTFKFTLH